MEHFIVSNLPDFKMFDFKVDYENHSSFTNIGKRKRKHGSPVRIFTNIPLKEFDLSGFPGYKFCKDCRFWVADENRHCDECGYCTSKVSNNIINNKKLKINGKPLQICETGNCFIITGWSSYCCWYFPINATMNE